MIIKFTLRSDYYYMDSDGVVHACIAEAEAEMSPSSSELVADSGCSAKALIQIIADKQLGEILINLPTGAEQTMMASKMFATFATYRHLAGAHCVRHSYVMEGSRVVRACTHKHRSDRMAKQCAHRMLREMKRNGGNDE